MISMLTIILDKNIEVNVRRKIMKVELTLEQRE